VGGELFWERVLGSVYVPDESGPLELGAFLSARLSVGVVLTGDGRRVEDHQLSLESLESFLSHNLY
jgi:hypothetical protein